MAQSSCNTDLIQVTEGATGPVGVAGPQINIFSIEGIYTFTGSSPFFTRTINYVIEKGNIWKPKADHVYTEFNPKAGVTLTTFLKDATKKFNVHINIKEIKSIGTSGVLVGSSINLLAETFNVDDDKIEFRFINRKGIPLNWNQFNNANISEVQFSLLILGLDDF